MKPGLLRYSVIVCGLVLLFIGTGQAAMVHVDAANTSGIEDGSIQFPFATIQQGLDAAAAGDTVAVAPGIYYGAIELKDQVALVGEQGPGNTIIDGMGALQVIHSPYSPQPRSSINGFTIRNGNNLIYATNRVSFWAASYLDVRDVVLQDGAIALQIMPGAYVTVANTVISNISLRGVDAIWCPPPQFINVTVDNAQTAFFIYQIGISLVNTSVTNVVNFVELWGHRGTGYVSGSHDNIWGYENYSVPNWNGGYAQIALQNVLSADPLFQNPPVDFRLRAGSPLIDAGLDVGLPFYGAAPDIGAYEHSPASILELAAALAESYQKVPLGSFKNAAEQRLKALHNKFMAILNMLSGSRDGGAVAARKGVLQAALNKLMNDVWAKGDGFYGGNPNDDWITTREEQAALYPKVMELKAAIEMELSGL